MLVELIKTFQFEAAHRRGGRLHGHSYIAELRCAGECDPKLGWLIDYGDISCCFEPLYRQLDHHLLEEVEGLAETSLAGLEQWLTERLAVDIPHFDTVRVRIAGACAFRPERVEHPDIFGAPPRVRFGFEAAHFLPNLPPAHKCHNMHGHSFCVDVAAADLGAVEPGIRSAYDVLDRRCLNEIDGLYNATSEQVARWVWEHLQGKGKDGGLTSVTVAETCTARCVYRGR